jgi:hypothetical protein
VEILALRHQLNVLRRKSPKRPTFSGIDRLVFAGLYRLAPGVLNALTIIKPETVIRWHRAGFRAYWRWKSRPYSGRPKTPLEIRQLIREISIANPLWGAPRIHGELLKLGEKGAPRVLRVRGFSGSLGNQMDEAGNPRHRLPRYRSSDVQSASWRGKTPPDLWRQASKPNPSAVHSTDGCGRAR